MTGIKWHVYAAACLGCMIVLVSRAAQAEPVPGRDDKIVLCYMVELQRLELAREWPKILELPFNGMIFRPGNHQKIMGPEEIPWSVWQQDVDELNSVDFGHFRDNFLYMAFSSGWAGTHVDWFDDWTPAIANLKNMARAARLAGLKGLIWDPEGYRNTPHFHYPHPGTSPTRTEAEYKARVRELAEQIIAEICEVYPDITIVSLFGYTNAGMNMLPTFLDGLLAGSDPRFVLVDGQEGSYYYKDKADFARRYVWMRHPDSMGFNRCNEKERWARQGQGGFGLFVTTGMSGTWQSQAGLLDMNYFNPPDFRRALANAVNLSDRYVWLYTEAAFGSWVSPKSNWYPLNMAPVYLEIVSEVTGIPYRPSPGAAAALSKVQSAIEPSRLSIGHLPAGVGPPVIDGNLSDPAWDKAVHIPDFERHRAYAYLPLAGETEAWVTYDADALYAAWRCREPDMNSLIVKGNEQRDSDVYSGDSIELWLTSGPGVRPAYQVIINPENQTFDARDLKAGDYDGACRSAVLKRERDWQVELALPWTDLGAGAPQPGAVRRANLNRIRRGRPDQLRHWRKKGLSTRAEISSWSPYDRRFTEITNLGYWVFR